VPIKDQEKDQQRDEHTGCMEERNYFVVEHH